MWEVPRGNMLYTGPKPETSKEKGQREASETWTMKAGMLNQLLSDAYMKGELQNQFTDTRAALTKIGMGGPISWLYKNLGTDKQGQLESTYDLINTQVVADYLKNISGAQVAAAEYDRLSKAFPSKGDTAIANVRLGYMNAVLPQLLLNLEKTGVMNTSNSATLGNAAMAVMQANLSKYERALNDVAAKKNSADARKKQNLGQYTDSEAITQDVLRTAFPQYQGKTLTIPDDVRNRDVYVYVP